jgi:hypothetical protein
MRIFKNKVFSRFSKKEAIDDEALKSIIPQLEAGLADADLGGGVYKVRVARCGEGKRGGYRVIVLFKSGDKTFFVYGFAKSDMGDIDEKELKYYKNLSGKYFRLTDELLNESLKTGSLEEIGGNER